MTSDYYGQPVLKAPVWKWMIPAYFFTGGIAGGAMTLGGVAQAADGRAMRPFAVRCFWVGAAAGTVSGVLLMADLGRPLRFLNMFRVLRVTSPMSIGSWILASAMNCSFGAVLLPGRAGRLAGYGAALSGIPLCGYTAVLIANTAVPAWRESRRTLPVLFTGSAMASAGAVLKLIPGREREHRVANLFGNTGAAIELAAGEAIGGKGALWNAAKVLTAASVVLSLWPGGRRETRIASALLAATGSLCMRFAIFEAGKLSTMSRSV